MHFTKLEGIGNDYIYVDGIHHEVDTSPAFIQALCDRHFGVGSDGLIVLDTSQIADFKMRMFNSDGSEGRMCGNGIRGLAKFAYEHHLTTKTRMTFETLAGMRSVELIINDGQVTGGTVDMGQPSLKTADLPMNVASETFCDSIVMIGNQAYRGTAVSMGNPHFVILIDQIPEDITAIGECFNDRDRKSVV